MHCICSFDEFTINYNLNQRLAANFLFATPYLTGVSVLYTLCTLWCSSCEDDLVLQRTVCGVFSVFVTVLWIVPQR